MASRTKCVVIRKFVAIPVLILTFPIRMDSPLQIAVLGSGIGTQHIQSFQELPNLFQV